MIIYNNRTCRKRKNASLFPLGDQVGCESQSNEGETHSITFQIQKRFISFGSIVLEFEEIYICKE